MKNKKKQDYKRVYAENLFSQKYVVVKRRGILIAFSDSCEYSFPMLYEKSTSGIS